VQTDLYSGALFVQVCLGWNLYLSTVLMLLVTGLYTIAGRLLTVWLLWLNHATCTPILLFFVCSSGLILLQTWLMGLLFPVPPSICCASF